MSCQDCTFKVGQIGAIIVVQLVQKDADGVESAFDVSAATTMTLHYQPPDGSAVKTLTLVFAAVVDGGNGLGTDGWVKAVTTVVGDLPASGDYEAEPEIIDPTTGFNGRTQDFIFPVEAILA